MTGLQTFLYLLMRDHLPAGTVAGLIKNMGASEPEFTNRFLAEMAKAYATSILENKDIDYGKPNTD